MRYALCAVSVSNAICQGCKHSHEGAQVSARASRVARRGGRVSNARRAGDSTGARKSAKRSSV
eukprot:4577038-Pyramimonas_sp.AAC.1